MGHTGQTQRHFIFLQRNRVYIEPEKRKSNSCTKIITDGIAAIDLNTGKSNFISYN